MCVLSHSCVIDGSANPSRINTMSDRGQLLQTRFAVIVRTYAAVHMNNEISANQLKYAHVRVWKQFYNKNEQIGSLKTKTHRGQNPNTTAAAATISRNPNHKL